MGYGHAHEQRRRELLAKLRDGDPCCRCRKPMYRAKAAELDADHYRRPRALDPDALPDALAHRSCNRRAGARLGLALRGIQSRGRRAAPRTHPVITSHEW